MCCATHYTYRVLSMDERKSKFERKLDMEEFGQMVNGNIRSTSYLHPEDECSASISRLDD